MIKAFKFKDKALQATSYLASKTESYYRELLS